MPLVRIRNVEKPYGGLRPFRLRELEVDAGECVVLSGMDRQSAVVLTDLLTGTTLPEGAGSIEVGGKSTSAVTAQDDWLAFVDHFGIVNDRVVLLDELSVAANLAIPLTLDVSPLAPGVRGAVELLADEIGVQAGVLDEALSGASAGTRLRVRLGRALAHNPTILLVEHPTLDLQQADDVSAFFTVLQDIVGRRKIAAIVATADPRVSKDKASRFLRWNPASGKLAEPRSWRR